AFEPRASFGDLGGDFAQEIHLSAMSRVQVNDILVELQELVVPVPDDPGAAEVRADLLAGLPVLVLELVQRRDPALVAFERAQHWVDRLSRRVQELQPPAHGGVARAVRYGAR